jgi:hypothetical protein
MTNPEPTDYAALIGAVIPNSERKHPEWLDPRQQVFSSKYGQGKVISWVGNTLIVKFSGYSIPVPYKNWQQAIEKVKSPLGRHLQHLNPHPKLKKTG